MKNKFYKPVKRTADIVFGIFGCIPTLPVLAAVKIAYLATGDKNPIIYKHTRIGKDGKEFTLYKIRTMIPNAEEELEKLLKNDKKLREEYELNKKLENDPRITKAGNFLRRYSIDETPQFFNILLGHMSLIGNRPYMLSEKKDMGKHFSTIVATKPGLVSYWAVNGRNNLDFKTRLKLEKYYSENISPTLDLKILFSAPMTVIKGKGAK